MRIKTIIITFMAFIASSCTMTRQPDILTMDILNERLSNIEKELNTRSPMVKEKIKEKGLTKAQKECIKLIIKQLGE